MKFGLYIKNHKKRKGIEDYIFVVKSILSSKNNSLNFVNDSKDKFDVLFFIENFTDNIQSLNNYLIKEKEKGTKYVSFIHNFLTKMDFLTFLLLKTYFLEN